MFEVVKTGEMSFDEVHAKWPNKTALVFDMVHKPYLFSKVKVYAIGDNTDECLAAMDLFKLEFPNRRYTIAHTSPTDDFDNSKPLYKD